MALSDLILSQAWEFKHPEFRANSKDSLDNIRRKAPAPRKQTQSNEESVPTQQIDLLNQQIVAQQQQIQHLSDRYAQLTVDHQLMLQEVMRVQKTVLNHENVIQQVMTYLLSVDARQRRDSKALTFQAQGGAAISASQGGAVDDQPSSPLQQASKLLSDMQSEMQFNLAAMDPTANDPQKAGAVPVAAPTMDPAAARNGVAGVAGVARPVSTAPPNPAALVYPKMGGDLEQVVYPVGATNGIDPMYSDHVNNVPYPMPAKPEVNPAEAQRYQDNGNRKKTTNVDPGWVRSPQILLVEDDATCRQIGGKFLYSFNCVVDTAVCLDNVSPNRSHGSRHWTYNSPIHCLVRRSGGRKQDARWFEIRFDSYGHHHAEPGWCICLPSDPPIRPYPYHRHDLEHP